MCFPSFKTIYEIVHCVKSKAVQLVTIYLLSRHLHSFIHIYHMVQLCLLSRPFQAFKQADMNVFPLFQNHLRKGALCLGRNKYAHHTSHIYHKWYIFQGHIRECVCAIYEVTSINHVTRRSIYIPHKLHFMLLACHWINIAATLQIKVTWPSFCVGIQMWHWCTYVPNTTNCNIYYTDYCHIWFTNRWPVNCTYTFEGYIRGIYVYVYQHMKSLASTVSSAALHTYHNDASDCTGCFWPKSPNIPFSSRSLLKLAKD